jgi:hypothetical protein
VTGPDDERFDAGDETEAALLCMASKRYIFGAKRPPESRVATSIEHRHLDSLLEDRDLAGLEHPQALANRATDVHMMQDVDADNEVEERRWVVELFGRAPENACGPRRCRVNGTE